VSDVSGRAQDIPAQTVGASYGDALLAAAAVGMVPPDNDWTTIVATVQPRPELADLCDRRYAVYRDLYTTTRPLIPRLLRPGRPRSRDWTCGNSWLSVEADVQDEMSEPQVECPTARPVDDERKKDDGQDDDHQPEEEHDDAGYCVPAHASRSSHGRQLPAAARLIPRLGRVTRLPGQPGRLELGGHDAGHHRRADAPADGADRVFAGRYDVVSEFGHLLAMGRSPVRLTPLRHASLGSRTSHL
jgi:hypothetical protein